MTIDRLIPASVAIDVDDRRKARLIIYAISIAIVATALVAAIAFIQQKPWNGLLVLASTIPYLFVLLLLHVTRSVRATAHIFMITLFAMISFDLGKESSYGILAGIALPVAAAPLLGVTSAAVWTAIGIFWQIYLAPLVLRVDDFTLEGGMSSAVITLAVGIASCVVEHLRERAVAEAQAHKQKFAAYSERIRNFVETTFPAMVEFAEDRFSAVNDGFSDLLGYDPGTITARNIDRFLNPDDLTQLRSLMFVSNGEGFHAELRMRHVDGHWMWLELFGIPLPDQRAQNGWMLAARDAHDEVVSRDHLLQAQKLGSVGTLAAGLAHDLNNLLTVVVGHASLLPESEGRNQILQASSEATQLIRSLRSFTQPAQPSPSSTDVVSAVQQVADMAARLLGSRINLHTDIAVEQATVRLESSALKQLLLNLITNAREAIDDAGNVTLSVNRRLEGDQPMIVIQITDDGRGMDETTLRRAVEPFYSTKPDHEGSGLGLASAYGIAQRAAGNLSLTSTPDTGTTATIELPESGLPDIESAAELDLAMPDYTGEACVLVDDDVAVREVLNRCLQSLGFTVHQASNAQTGLTLVAEHKTSLVVTDIIMPGMRGTEFTRQLRTLYPELPVLLVSGYSGEESTTRPDQWTRFLAKPIGLQDLARQLTDLLPTD